MADQLSSDLASLRIDRKAKPQSQRSWGRAVGTIAALALCVVGGALVYPRIAAAVFKTEITLTEISMISPAQASISITSSGYVVPQVISRIGAKIPGRISRVLVKEGDAVKACDVLIELEDADQRAAIAAAQARVSAAAARASASRANIAEIKIQADRQKALVESGAAGKATLDDLVARVTSLEKLAVAADAEIRAAQAEVESLRVLLQDRIIKAPISGTILTKPPEVGEMTATLPFLIELADFNSLVVETDVAESRLQNVTLGAPCEIVLDAYPARRLPGKALEIGKRVNRAKATVPVKVAITGDRTGVLPDMAARVSFLTKEISAEAMKEPPKRIVPATAVVERAGGKVVFIVDQGRVKIAGVRVGTDVAGGFELLDGPPPGTKLVANPPADLQDGQKIKEKERDDG
ncbi:MAG: efflux RND transporter periplasmic adaptor subunit [Polyangiaceae bacterium]|nr:efflux RND transporter periplasmic adaptor subunit [Polyangiaceae bacterium]